MCERTVYFENDIASDGSSELFRIEPPSYFTDSRLLCKQAGKSVKRRGRNLGESVGEILETSRKKSQLRRERNPGRMLEKSER